jgi:glyoxylase-like metal-dependent hydrolase (beta-lactamase superfamily II)
MTLRPMPIASMSARRAAAAAATLLTCLAAFATAGAQQRGAGGIVPPIDPAAAVKVIAVQGNVTMIAGPGANVTVQAGADGPLVVDTPAAAAAEAVFQAIGRLSPKPIHTIVNTHFHADHTAGTAALVKLRGAGPQAVRVMAHDNVLTRLTAAAAAGDQTGAALRVNNVITLPVTSPLFTPSRDFFLNGEAVFVYHVPAAHTDGDTIVHFRGSDVISAGDVFRPDSYPVIDVQNGGTVNGVIGALNRIIEIAVPARFQEGGTRVVPGHGRLSDEADVVEYRDMVTIVRDRVRGLVKQGRTLAQVKEARPTRDFDTEYGAATGFWTSEMFVEAVFGTVNAK